MEAVKDVLEQKACLAHWLFWIAQNRTKSWYSVFRRGRSRRTQTCGTVRAFFGRLDRYDFSRKRAEHEA